MTTGNDFKDFNEQDFINHPLFQDWILYPTEERNSFWQHFFAAYPSKKETAEKAAMLLKAIAYKESWPSEQEVEHSLAQALNLISQAPEKAMVYKIRPMIKPLYKWIAAAVLVLMVGGVWLYKNNLTNADRQVALITKAQDVEPGGDKAVLTLADGSKVVLDTAGNGAITKQGNMMVVKLNGQLAYQPSGATTTSSLSYNTITTPRGGQYQLILADSTKVWLNAESSLRFPTAFAGKQRRVELTGEGYFEVAHNEQQPFIVQRGDAEVQVLGTHFNVNGYSDEPSLKVTLLQGRVLVKKSKELVYLNPGQQALVQPGDQNIKVDYDVDIEEVTAWKNGLFVFNNTPLQTIMKQLQRWYDVEVVYQGQVPKDQFNGSISRDNNLSEVLKVLEYSNVKFSVAGKTITVLP